jgi:uncharacterized protein (TIGR01777 family)
MATICITGGSGMIGKAMAVHLTKKGYRVIILTRTLPAADKTLSDKVIYKLWDIDKKYIDPEAVKNTDTIIHLAGTSVADKRWSEKRKMEILKSRTESGKLLIHALQSHPHQVKTIISASAIGWYGPDQGTIFTEDAPVNNDFLGETCRQWEASLHPAIDLDIRLVTLRIGIVLSSHGGALPEFLKPIRFGIAPILGSGEQMISWIHVDDLCRIFEKSLTDTNIKGIYNAVAPQPVSNKNFMLALAKQWRKFFIPIHAPAFALKLALGEMSVEVLKSCTVSSAKIQQTGLQFIYPSIESALKQLNR